jgi:bacteriorhodopsin
MVWATMLLVGALVRSGYKWGFWVIAVVVYFLLCWQVMGVARQYAARHDDRVAKVFVGLAAWELFLMLVPLPPPPSDSLGR